MNFLIVFLLYEIPASEFLSRQVNFCPGKLILKLLTRIGEWHQNLGEKTEYCTIWSTFKVHLHCAS